MGTRGASALRHVSATPTAADVVRLEPADFDTRFQRPKTAVNVPLNKVNGRCGDLLVYQMRGSSHSLDRHQASLRSLGLSGYQGTCLRWVGDPVTFGQLESVKHLVGIVKLPEPWYKEWISPYYESQQYGTQSRPGQVWRGLGGEYIGYRSDESGIALFMSTSAEFAEVLALLQSEGLKMEPDFSSPEAWVSYKTMDGQWSSARGYASSFLQEVDATAVQAVSLPIKSLGRVGPTTETMTLTWEASVEKFHDIERVSHELGVITVKEYRPTLRSFRDRFSEIRSRAECPVSLSVVDNGRRVDFPI